MDPKRATTVSLGPGCHLIGEKKRMKASGSRDVHRFLGIPYASYTRRFQAANPMQEWEGTRYADKYGAADIVFYVQAFILKNKTMLHFHIGAICPQDFSLFSGVMKINSFAAGIFL
jgi:hypothetical protein